MKKYVLLSLCFFYFSFAQTFAIDIPESVEIQKVSDTTMELDWQDVENAIGYYVYYGTKSGSGSTYEVEWIDLIDTSDFLLEWLKAETKYYIAFTAVDPTGDESKFSKEFEYTTLAVGQSEDVRNFKIIGVNVIDASTLEFSFSAPVDTKALTEFKIENKITKEEIGVDISEVDTADNSKILILLWKNLLENTQYNVTAISVTNQKGNSIESWIDAFINFSTPKAFQETNSTVSNTTVPPTWWNTEEDLDLLSAPMVQTTANINAWNAGTTISQSDIDSNTLAAAASNEKLPETGPEHWMLLIIAALFSGLIYFMNNKKIFSR